MDRPYKRIAIPEAHATPPHNILEHANRLARLLHPRQERRTGIGCVSHRAPPFARVADAPTAAKRGRITSRAVIGRRQIAQYTCT
jgi:hypothetical protein